MLSFQHIINTKLLLKYFTLYFMILSLWNPMCVLCYCACMLRCSVTSDSETPWTEAHQASLSMRFSQQEYWNGVSFPPPGYLPDVGITPLAPTPLALARGFFTPSATWGALCIQFSSVAQLCLTLWPHGLQHSMPPCPTPTPGVYSNSCPLSQWCRPTISSSVVPFSSCPQSLPASGSFPRSQLFAAGGQNIGVSASTSVLPMNTQDWSPLGWTGWISLQSKGLSRVFSNTTVQKHQFFGAQLSL